MSWWIAILPEAVLVVAGVVLLGLGLARGILRGVLTAVALAGLAGALAVLFLWPVHGEWLRGAILLTMAVQFGRAVILVLAVGFVLLCHETLREVRHYAELLGMGLFAVAGMLVLAAAGDLLMVFLGLELAGMPLYAMAAWRKVDARGVEAGVKFFLAGGVSAAVMVYGMSLVYGVAGGMGFRVIAGAEFDPLLVAGGVLVLAGFAFKVAAVPFHLWAPDVYVGAPTAVASLVATGSKVAGVFALAKLVGFVFGAWAQQWEGVAVGIVLAVVGAASVLVGNLGALSQREVKRLLAFSAVAQGGYLLIGFAGGERGVYAGLFFVVIYAAAAGAAFASISLAEKDGRVELEDLRGFSRQQPLAAAALLLSLVSMAGIPPLAGFFGKFWLFASAFEVEWLRWLVAFAIAMNAVSLYYYLQVVKFAYLANPNEGASTGSRSSAILAWLAFSFALLLLVFGLQPNFLSYFLRLE